MDVSLKFVRIQHILLDILLIFVIIFIINLSGIVNKDRKFTLAKKEKNLLIILGLNLESKYFNLQKREKIRERKYARAFIKNLLSLFN